MKMKQFFRSPKQRAETIIEILTAITVITLVITSTYSVLLRASKTNTAIKNRVIALNIAREGLEGVRNIRDTNWLRYSGDRRGKWLCRDAYLEFGSGHTRGDCSSAPAAPYDFSNPIPNSRLQQAYKVRTGECQDLIESGYYILERVPLSGFYALFLDSRCNVGNVGPYYILEPKLEIDLNATTDAANLIANRDQFRLYYDSTRSDTVRHASHAGESCFTIPCTPSNPYVETPFYRRIKIEIVHPFENPDGGADLDDINGFCVGNCEQAKMKVTSFVEWEEDGTFQNVQLETHLFDFYERDNY